MYKYNDFQRGEEENFYLEFVAALMTASHAKFRVTGNIQREKECEFEEMRF